MEIHNRGASLFHAESAGRSFLVFAVLVLGALGVRLLMFDYQSRDYTDVFKLWYEFIINHGKFESLKHEFYNYTPPYIYLMSLSTHLNLQPLHAIKVVSLIFEAALGVLAFKIVWRLHRNAAAAYGACAATLFFPTVLLNGALWGQSDALHTSMVLLSIYWLAQGKGGLACTAYGAALSFKLQAVFVAPLFLIAFFLRRVRWTHLMALPYVYLLMIFPCVLAGRSLESLLTIYLKQTVWQPEGASGLHHSLTLNAANFYQWIPNTSSPAIFILGMAVSVGLTALLMASVISRWKRGTLSLEDLLLLALLFSVLEPFFLPRMHERYFYTADVLAIIYAFARRDRWFIPVLVGSASLLSYFPFLFRFEPIKLSYAAVATAVALAVLLKDFFSNLERRGAQSIECPINDLNRTTAKA